MHFTPDSGMWSGGTFSLEFKWTRHDGTPVVSPTEPPNVRATQLRPVLNLLVQVKCLTTIWHPNIDLNGDICHAYVLCRA